MFPKSKQNNNMKHHDHVFLNLKVPSVSVNVISDADFRLRKFTFTTKNKLQMIKKSLDWCSIFSGVDLLLDENVVGRQQHASFVQEPVRSELPGITPDLLVMVNPVQIREQLEKYRLSFLVDLLPRTFTKALNCFLRERNLV